MKRRLASVFYPGLWVVLAAASLEPICAYPADRLEFHCLMPEHADAMIFQRVCGIVRSEIEKIFASGVGRVPNASVFVFEATRYKEKPGAGSVSGHLRWTTGGSGQVWRSGVEVTAIVTDTALNEQILRDFARQLAKTIRF